MGNDTTFIYALVDPRDNQVRYIGKTDDPQRRFRRHLTETGHTHRHHWIAQLIAADLRPILVVIEIVAIALWPERETYWIGFYKSQGCNLVNATSGGEGASGLSPSDDTRERLRRAAIRQHEAHPRHLSDSHKESLQAGLARKRSSQTWQKAVRAKIGNANRGKRRTAEQRQQLSLTRTGVPHKPHSAATRQKLSEQKKAENNPNAKLTMDKARQIRQLYATGEYSLSQLALLFGVDTKQIHRIVRNEAWQE